MNVQPRYRFLCAKRQEIYVKKAELYAKLDSVPLAERPIFDPLRAALDVAPGTAPPPSVR